MYKKIDSYRGLAQPLEWTDNEFEQYIGNNPDYKVKKWLNFNIIPENVAKLLLWNGKVENIYNISNNSNKIPLKQKKPNNKKTNIFESPIDRIIKDPAFSPAFKQKLLEIQEKTREKLSKI